MKINLNKYPILVKQLMIVCALFLFFQNGIVSNAATGNVKAASAKIRSSADASSEVLASVVSGNTVDIISQVTADNGYVWYKVYVDGSTQGYIRSDLVTVTGTVPAETTTTTDETAENTSNDASNDASNDTAENDVLEKSDVVKVKVIGSTVRVRSSASTSSSVVDNATMNTEATVSGQYTATDGVWYQVNYTLNSKEITGFIRSDFLEIIETVSEESTEVVEEEPTVEEKKEDYYLVYEENSAGNMDWFVYDTLSGTKKSLTGLLDLYAELGAETQTSNDSLPMIIAIVVLAVLLVIAIISIIVLLFKNRNSYYEYEEEDFEEEADEEEELEEEEKEVIKEKKLFFKPQKEIQNTEEKIEEVLEEKIEPKETQNQWKSKNFIEIDDEFEFEFLDFK
ncbi:MAG: SH3 domain-containing protein [Lachnospiraceae bacterium]